MKPTVKSAWIALLVLSICAGAAVSGEWKDCAYLPKKTAANPYPNLEVCRNCVSVENGKISLSKEFIRKLGFDEHGLASVAVDGRYYYAKRSGAMLPVISFENWADDYAEGLVRSMVDGRIAYFDRRFRQVIAPRYDWGAPFENGRALVCKGCGIEPSDEEGHRRVAGGLWGYIDRKGREVVPVKFTRDEIERE